MFSPEKTDIDETSVMIDYRINDTVIVIDYWLENGYPRVTVFMTPDEVLIEGSLLRAIGRISEKMKFTYTQKNEFSKNLIDSIRELIK